MWGNLQFRYILYTPVDPGIKDLSVMYPLWNTLYFVHWFSFIGYIHVFIYNSYFYENNLIIYMYSTKNELHPLMKNYEFDLQSGKPYLVWKAE